MLALSWLPLALAGHLVEADRHLLAVLVAAVMFLSFAHQPLTLPLVYASPWRLATHRRLFLWCPIVALVVVVVFSQVNLLLVAVVGALWNAEHTLMQRYGIARIYGRKAGDDQGHVEKWMFLSWLVIPLLWVAGRGELPAIVARLNTGNIDGTAADLLARLSTEARFALPVVAAVATYLSARWLVTECRLGSGLNPGKCLYVASTAALFAFAVVDPIAGVIGFVGSHSIEYFVLVNRSVASETRHEGTLGKIARLRYGRLSFFVAYGAAAVGLFYLLFRVTTPRVLLVTVLTIGALHFFYDAFIWKLRRPDVATSLGASQAAVHASAGSGSEVTPGEDSSPHLQGTLPSQP